MTIKTKYNIGDTIWYMGSNQVCSNKIAAIQTNVHKVSMGKGAVKPSAPTVEYTTVHITGDPAGKVTENKAFATKADLLKSM